ncbi:radical SAM/SPASM domain-containing protein [Clostridium tyrobutyricum]|uniref:radical SAM/SPASM domain-containing protein n=1 Tax=Clostridium tyrobutyricum TaxID=1519 RepID=UPI0010AA3C1B|nr:radical SAM protein [Clostridium tyrobutyricum]QCH26959.1 Antilisterial bacteriocin subtilosin biosynthesis protein AlbA [Clostridium tyrobutyricum]
MNNNINVPVNPTYHEVVNDFAKEWEKNKSERYKEYRRKWSENPKNFIVEDAPLHLDIEPTNACNLKCPMCPRTVIVNDDIRSKNFTVGIMEFYTFKKIIDEAVQIGVYSIKLNWLGEPLVHPQIVDMVRYAKQKGIIDVMFNTNAALLNEELSKQLIEAGIDKIFFSFDSPFKEKYEQIRVGAKFEDTFNNIKKLIQIRNEMGRTSPLTRVSMVLMENNKDEYDEFIKLFKDIVDVVAYVEYREPIASVKDKIDYEKKFACSQLWQRMFISWNGDVVPCCVDSEKEIFINNVNKVSIKNIWNSSKYNNLRENHKNGEWYKENRCKKCDIPNKIKDGTI